MLFFKRYFQFKIKYIVAGYRRADKIYINISDEKLARYTYLFTIFMSKSFNVYFYPNFRFLTNLTDYSEWIIDEPNIFLSKKKLKPDEGVIYFQREKIPFRLNYNYFTAVKNSLPGFIFPYFMHVGQYKWGYIENIKKLRHSVRTIPAFFIGGVSQKYYDNPLIDSVFGCLSRYKIIIELEKLDNVFFVQKAQELKKNIENGTRKTIIYITGTYRGNEKYWPQKDWLKTIARANFFLALPGTTMPLCHNLIEAMGVGTIPILQYGHFIYPKLIDQKNCIVFRNIEHLNKILVEIETYSEEKISRMRQHVIDYYEAYFSINSFAKNFAAFLDSKINNKELIDIYLNAELLSTKMYEKRKLKLAKNNKI